MVGLLYSLLRALDSSGLNQGFTRYFLNYFLPPIESAGFPASELAVAETFIFSFLGFLDSFLLFLPLAIVCPFKMQRFKTEMA